MKQVCKELVHSPRVREVNRLVDIARPLASDIKLLKPSLTREFKHYFPFKVSFTLTIVVFSQYVFSNDTAFTIHEHLSQVSSS